MQVGTNKASFNLSSINNNGLDKIGDINSYTSDYEEEELSYAEAPEIDEDRTYSSSPVTEALVRNGGCFDPSNDKFTLFGGNQGALKDNIEYYLEDLRTLRILYKYFPELFKEPTDFGYLNMPNELEFKDNASYHLAELLFNKMNTVGCGYVAACNTFMLHSLFIGESEYFERMGFQLYDLERNPDTGKLFKRYNYEYIFLDFFLYYHLNYSDLNSLEDILGNIEDEIAYDEAIDGALDEQDEFERTGAEGTYCLEVAEIFQQYLRDRGYNVNITNHIQLEFGSEEYELSKERLESMGVHISEGTELYKSFAQFTIDDYRRAVQREGYQVVVSGYLFPLYYPYDVDGNGLLDDAYSTSVGSHAMEVVNVTADGRLVVSSWGNIFIMDIESVNGGAIYDYFATFEPVEPAVRD